MHQLVQLLKKFDKEELSRFGKFLDSPYHNNSTKVKRMFDELKKFHPDFDDVGFNKKKLLKEVSPGIAFNESTFRNVISDLLSQVERFLTIEQAMKNEHERNIFLIRAMFEKENGKLLEKISKKELKSLSADGVEGKNYYFKSRLDLLRFNYGIINYNEKSEKSVDAFINTITGYACSLISFVIPELINSHLRLVVQEFKYRREGKSDITRRIINEIDINKILIIIRAIDPKNFILEQIGRAHV